MMDKKIFYVKILIAQIIAFGISQFLVGFVFFGPIPVVRPEFAKNVVKAPGKILDTAKRSKTSIISGIAKKAIPKKSDIVGGKATNQNKQGGIFSFPSPTSGFVTQAPTIHYPQPTTKVLITPPQSYPTPTSSYPWVTSLPTQAQYPTKIPTSVPAEPTTVIPTQKSTPQPTAKQNQPNAEIENEMLRLVNERRKQAGLGELLLNASLTSAARKHAQDQTTSNPDHTKDPHIGSDGSNSTTRARREGYSGSTREVVVWNAQSAKQAVDAWWGSQKHKEILTLSGARYIGFGWSKLYGVGLVGL